jgi:hypothetical protein
MIQFTPEVKEKTLALYKKMTLEEIRRRQDLCRQQCLSASQQKDDDALSDLQTMDRLLEEAFDFVAFGDSYFKKRKPSRCRF